MKLLSSNNILDLVIDVYYATKNSDLPLVATDVLPLYDESGNLDDYANENYRAFVWNVEEIINYYGFKKFKPRKSATSYYRYYAHESELANGTVSYYTQLRLSNHIEQLKSEKHLQEIKNRIRRDVEDLKLPKTKHKQRYRLQRIVVNETTHATYESALNDVEDQIRSWFDIVNANIDEYDDLGDWTV